MHSSTLRTFHHHQLAARSRGSARLRLTINYNWPRSNLQIQQFASSPSRRWRWLPRPGDTWPWSLGPPGADLALKTSYWTHLVPICSMVGACSLHLAQLRSVDKEAGWVRWGEARRWPISRNAATRGQTECSSAQTGAAPRRRHAAHNAAFCHDPRRQVVVATFILMYITLIFCAFSLLKAPKKHFHTWESIKNQHYYKQAFSPYTVSPFEILMVVSKTQMAVWLANLFKTFLTPMSILYYCCLDRGWVAGECGHLHNSPNSHTLVAALTVVLQAGGGLLQDCHSTWTPLPADNISIQLFRLCSMQHTSGYQMF